MIDPTLIKITCSKFTFGPCRLLSMASDCLSSADGYLGHAHSIAIGKSEP